MAPRPDYRYQTQIFDPATFGHPLTMIGCGGIGGSVLSTLATLGLLEIHLWDSQSVAATNIATTLTFGPKDDGQPKVEVVARELRRLGVAHVVPHQMSFKPWRDRASLEGVVASGVDTMAARREVWKAVQWNPRVPLYFDCRVGGPMLWCDIVRPTDPDDVRWYEKHELFGDDQVAPLPCAARAVAYAAVALGAVMAGQLGLFSRDEPTFRQIVMNVETMQVVLQR